MIKPSEQDFLKKLGSKVRSIRNERKLSLNQMAELHGFEKAGLSRLEAGKTNITMLTLFKLSAALNVKVTDFFAG